jgi:hypothetical protein
VGKVMQWYWNMATWLYRTAHLFSRERERYDRELEYWHSECARYRDQWRAASDALAEKTLELATLKNKIVERAASPPIMKAKSAAEIRRIVEQQNEREFEESANA